MRIIGFFVAIFVFSGLASNTAFAEIKSMSLQIDGLSCPFCALSLEKKLKSVPAISTVEVHLKKAQTDLNLKPDGPLDLTAIRQAVKEAGFTLKDIQVAVFGVIKRNDNGFFMIESRGDQTQFFLFDGNHTDADVGSSDPQMLDSKIESQLSTAEKKNQLVGIEGIIHQHADMPFGLLISKLEITSE